MSIEIIRTAVELTLLTGQLEDDQPSSLFITAEVEEGKTHLVAAYSQLPTVAYLADATAYGIVREYQADLQAGRKKHFVFPELIRPLERQSETASSLIAFLAELMEEGVKEIQTYATSFRLPNPVRAGVIACMARGSLAPRLRYWNETGFFSRFLPLSYSYGKPLADEVMKAIRLRTQPQPTNFVLPRPATIVLPEEIGGALADMAPALAKGIYSPLHGFRMLKHLQRLAMASALRDGRRTVNEKDLQIVQVLADYVNLDYKPL